MSPGNWLPSPLAQWCLAGAAAPVPLSNFFRCSKSGAEHPAQQKVPGRFSRFKGEVPERSVPRLMRTSYAAGESCARHSSSVFFTSTSPTGFWRFAAQMRRNGLGGGGDHRGRAYSFEMQLVAYGRQEIEGENGKSRPQKERNSHVKCEK